jgi:hypothetical protein
VRLFVSTFATIDTVIDLHVELYEAYASRDVTTFQNALIQHYVETEKTFGMDSVCFRIAKPRLVTDCSSNHGEAVSSVVAA